MKEELRKIIKEELIKESLMSNILSFLAGWVLKGSAQNKPDAKKIISDPDVRKAVAGYVNAHQNFVNTLNDIEKKYGIEYPSYLKEPLKKPIY